MEQVPSLDDLVGKRVSMVLSDGGGTVEGEFRGFIRDVHGLPHYLWVRRSVPGRNGTAMTLVPWRVIRTVTDIEGRGW